MAVAVLAHSLLAGRVRPLCSLCTVPATRGSCSLRSEAIALKASGHSIRSIVLYTVKCKKATLCQKLRGAFVRNLQKSVQGGNTHSMTETRNKAHMAVERFEKLRVERSKFSLFTPVG